MMQNENIHLIIGQLYQQSMWQFAEEPGVEKHFVFRGYKSWLITLIRKIWFKINLPGKNWWYRKELLQIEGKCVVFDADAPYQFLEWFAKCGRQKQLVFFYWNSYENYRISPQKVKELGYDVWSFDPENCKKFGMKFNPEFFCKSWYTHLHDIETKYDIVFMGRDKNGRMAQVEKIVERFGKEKYKWNLYFTANHWYDMFASVKYKKFLNLRDMLSEEMKAKVILDYSQDCQSSITNRTFDALYNQRKLITNIKAIKQEKFYNPNNIFVIDDDDDSAFDHFMKSEFEPMDEKALEERSFNVWITRFFETESDNRC